ncbi:hypothetical protein ABK040_008383 [Willaertia magna]
MKVSWRIFIIILLLVVLCITLFIATDVQGKRRRRKKIDKYFLIHTEDFVDDTESDPEYFDRYERTHIQYKRKHRGKRHKHNNHYPKKKKCKGRKCIPLKEEEKPIETIEKEPCDKGNNDNNNNGPLHPICTSPHHPRTKQERILRKLFAEHKTHEIKIY